MALIWAASLRVLLIDFRLILLRIRAITRAAKAPTAPASSGVNTPEYIPPSTISTRMAIPQTLRNEKILFFQLMSMVEGGASDGRNLAMAYIPRLSRPARSIPGPMPAMNIRPIDCSVKIPKKIMRTLGGMSMARAPAEAIDAVPKVGLYPCFFISGRLNLQKMLIAATVEPQAAPNKALAMTVEIERPPRILPSQAAPAS